MGTLVKDEKSEWREVKRGVPQGSVLTSIMFLVQINDMTRSKQEADEPKLLRKIRNHKDCKDLRNDIDKIYEWSQTWEMIFN